MDKKYKLLIVDNDESTREYFERVLRDQYDIDMAEDGRHGARMVFRDNYDLVLLELRMPNWDGIDMMTSCELVSPKTNFLVVSGHLTEENIAKISSYPNCLGYVSKPVDRDQLREAVSKIFE